MTAEEWQSFASTAAHHAVNGSLSSHDKKQILLYHRLFFNLSLQLFLINLLSFLSPNLKKRAAYSLPESEN